MKKIFLSILCLFLVTGCGNEVVEENKDNNDQTTTKEPEVVKEIQVVDLNSNSRPIAIMINNISVAQPYQTGLNDAYIVYEMIVEGGITRMLAIFKDSNLASVGTIRSARPYYLDYALENDAVYVHFGYSEQARVDINSLGIDNINGLTDNFYWREKFPVATEHTVYSSMKKINNTISKKGYRTTSDKDLLLNYSADEIDISKMENSVKADKVKIVYSTSQTNLFVYDETNKVYIRKSNGETRYDYVTKEAFTAKNIITYQVENTTSYEQGYGRQVLDNVGSGEGYYISNGYAVKIKWEKDSRSGQTVYKYLDGTEITVNDGNTYIQIQPEGQKLEITSN